MNNPDKMERLFDEFKPVSRQEWHDKIIADLKGADYNRKLVWKTREGFSVNPYYTADDLPDEGSQGSFPREFPFRRGNKLDNTWRIRQDIYVKDISEANKKALDILMKGVNSLGFIFDPSLEPTIDDIEKLCENIFADAVELNFVCHRNSLKVVQYVEKLVKKYNRELQDIYGSVDFDPLGQYVLHGKFTESAEASFDHAREMIESAAHLPNFRSLTVNGSYFHNSGSTIVQELAFSLAQGVNYLTQLTERELSINQVAPRIKFQFAIGSDYFMEMAKFRAARMLWAHIVKAYGPCDDSKTRMNIHAVTSSWNKTMYDAYVNMLRTTTEAMSAISGGIDSLTIQPFDAAYGESSEFSERIARNQQLLLKEESYLDKVADPAAGSYYIEHLTDAIATESWRLFLEIQEKGGFLEAFNAGFIQQSIKEAANTRDMEIATRREILLGTNQYPNLTETLSEELRVAGGAGSEEKRIESGVETLRMYRGAGAFEQLRSKTDRSSSTPKVFIIPMGNIAMRGARAQFMGNFFGCAGYEIINNNGFDTVDAAADACLKANADIAVLCSSDDEYSVLAPQLFNLLKGKTEFVIAGYPKAILEDLKKVGIKDFVHVKSNVLETLDDFQNRLNIA